jgi:hypothetical protein
MSGEPEYDQEVAGLVERLEEADRWLTPEHVAERFQALPDLDDSCPDCGRSTAAIHCAGE